MATPLVTIGITAYNAADTVVGALRSAEAQNIDAEIVVVDDASQDGTLRAIRAAISGAAHVRIIVHDANRGVAAARNSILEVAKGEFVAFFDDDDESAPDRLLKQVDRIRRYEVQFAEGAPVICHSARRQVMPDGAIRIEGTMGTDLTRAAPFGRRVAERILLGRLVRGGFGSLATCSQMARRTTYQRVGGFDASLRRSEDTDLSIRLALEGAHFVGLAEPLVTQRMTMASEKTLAEELRNLLVLYEKHRDLFGDEAQYDFCRRWQMAKFALLRGERTEAVWRLLKLGLRNPGATFARVLYALPMQRSRSAASRLHARG